jgi:hypothetical protein
MCDPWAAPPNDALNLTVASRPDFLLRFLGASPFGERRPQVRASVRRGRLQ